MEKQTDFRIRSYGRTELAQLYNPCLTPKAAYRKLVGWIDHYPGLAVRLAEPDMPCGKMSPSTQMPARRLPLAFVPANVVSQTKPIPGNIALIKLPTPADFWNRKRL